MTTEVPEKDRKPTDSVIYCIDNDKSLNGLIHDMLHTSKTVDEYTGKLDGLLRIFWGDSTPEGKSLDEVVWIDVIVQVLPTECLIPLFKASMMELEGKEYNSEEQEEQCGRSDLI